MNDLQLFAGIGGGLLASHLLGFSNVACVESNPYRRAVLRARQDVMPIGRIHNDIRTFPADKYVGQVDIVSAGFPCQDISLAGKGGGLDGEQSGLFWDAWRIVRHIGAPLFFVENSPALLSRGLGDILSAFAEVGWDAEWIVLGAGHVGAPHIRQRIWLVGADSRVFSGPEFWELGTRLARYPYRKSKPNKPRHGSQMGERAPLVADAIDDTRQQPHERRAVCLQRWNDAGAYAVRSLQSGRIVGPGWGTRPASIRGVDDGLTHRMDRLRGLGNAQVPRVAALAFAILAGRLAAGRSP